MMKLLLPLILAALGTGGGVAAAIYLVPAAAESEPELTGCVPMPGVEGAPLPEAHAEAADSHGAPAPAAGGHGESAGADAEYAKLNNQFVVPVVDDDRVSAMMLLSLSLEVPLGGKNSVFSHEPRLRDLFLQVLFDHANVGGFEGVFTSSSNLQNLRNKLLHAAREVLGQAAVIDVLITDIIRQDFAG